MSATLRYIQNRIGEDVEAIQNHILSGTCNHEQYLKLSGELAGLLSAHEIIQDQINKQESDE